MNTISDQLPESGKPPYLSNTGLSDLQESIRQKSLEESKSSYKYDWTLYLTEGGQCSYQDILAAFCDVHEYILDEAVIEGTLVGSSGSGFHLEAGSDWDGNPRDGYRRGIDIRSGGFTGIHFSCWIGEEWQYDPTIQPRFELPVRIKTNWDWPTEKQLWQFMAQRFAKIGYSDSTLSTVFKASLLKRLESYPNEQLLIEKESSSE